MPNNQLSPIQRYEQALASGDFSEDAQQRQAMQYLEKVYQQILDNQAKQKGLFSFLKRTEPPKGLYMWGGVGRGRCGRWDSSVLYLGRMRWKAEGRASAVSAWWPSASRAGRWRFRRRRDRRSAHRRGSREG